jgi:hypothetical protein
MLHEEVRVEEAVRPIIDTHRFLMHCEPFGESSCPCLHGTEGKREREGLEGQIRLDGQAPTALTA